MDKCSDYWCENYGTNNAICVECKNKDNDKDKPDLRVILRRRKIEQMDALELSHGTDVGKPKNSQGGKFYDLR